MKKLLTIIAACAAIKAFGIAASQAWVNERIEASKAETQANTRTTTTNDVMRIESKDVVLEMERNTDAALIASACTPLAIEDGITNGTIFVWNGAGSYINPNGTITASVTNLLYKGVRNETINGIERFAGYFDAKGAIIQPSLSHSITNDMEEVNQ